MPHKWYLCTWYNTESSFIHIITLHGARHHGKMESLRAKLNMKATVTCNTQSLCVGCKPVFLEGLKHSGKLYKSLYLFSFLVNECWCEKYWSHSKGIQDDFFFWSQKWVTMAQEHRFRPPQSPCSSVVAVWSFYKNSRKSRHFSNILVGPSGSWVAAQQRELCHGL